MPKHKRSKARSFSTPSPVLIIMLLISLVIFFAVLYRDAKHSRVKAQESSRIVVDHNSIALFDQIPDAYIQAAAAKRFLFIDRSVGANINFGLDCLAAGSPYATATNSCKTSLSAANYRSNTKYNRSNWVYSHYGDGGWYDNVSNFITNTGLRTPSGSAYTPNYNSFDIINYQFSYLDVASTSNITSPTNGFFIPYPGDTTRIRDIHDFVTFEASHPNNDLVYSTSSLGKSIGTKISYDFNNQMRDYTRNNAKPLLDVADILSHDTSGNPCYDNVTTDGANYPAICAQYSPETYGGHLAYGLSTQRMAMAMWVLMAQMSGWQPGGSLPVPVTATPILTPIPTPIPTLTTLPSPTTIPAPTITTGGSLIYYNTTDYNLDGTNYINLGNLSHLSSKNQFTFSIWLKPTFDETSTARKYVFSDGTAFGIFYLESSTYRNWRIMLRTTAGETRIDTKGIVWDPNTWHQLAVTYDGSVARIFWDKSQIKAQAVTGATVPDSLSMFIGTAPFPANHFTGHLDELRIYNTALSVQDIANLPPTP